MKFNGVDELLGTLNFNMKCNPNLRSRTYDELDKFPMQLYARCMLKLMTDFPHNTYKTAWKSAFSDEFQKIVFGVITELLNSNW
jgi:hypothetical protein